MGGVADMGKRDTAGNMAGALQFQDKTDALRFTLGQAIAVGLRLLGADEGSLLVAEPDGKSLRFAMVADRDGALPENAASSALVGKCVPIGEGVTGMAAMTHDVQTSADADGAGIPFHRVRGDRSPNAVLAAPMLLGDRLVGVITAVSFDRRKTFSSSQAQTYGMLANAAAGIVDCQLRIGALADSTVAPGVDAARDDSGENALVREVLSLARKRPGRIRALRGIVAAMEGFD